MRKSELLQENRLLLEKIQSLENTLRATKENVKTGLESPKELAITWLCHEYNAYYSRWHTVMPDWLEKLQAIAELDDAHGQCRCGKQQCDIRPNDRAE